MPETTASEKRINIPLSADLHHALRQRAASLGITMYELAAKAIEAELGDGTVSVNVDPSLGDVRGDEAFAAIAGDSHAPLSIALHYLNLDKPYLAAVMAAVAADRVSGRGDAEAAGAGEASKELARFAGRVRPRELKIVLLERAVALSSQNLAARNVLGQQLYFDKKYAEAIDMLEAVRSRDNRALLFYGFSLMRLALAEGDATRARDGRNDVVEALEGWSLGSRDPQDRTKWIRQLATLEACHPDYAQTVDDLIAYANMNSDWNEPVTRDDVAAAHEWLESVADAER